MNFDHFTILISSSLTERVTDLRLPMQIHFVGPFIQSDVPKNAEAINLGMYL
jgi:hypothetical protein